MVHLQKKLRGCNLRSISEKMNLEGTDLMVDHELVDGQESGQVVVLVAEPRDVCRLRIVVARTDVLRRRRRHIAVGTSVRSAFGALAGIRRRVARLVVGRRRRGRRRR